MHQTPDNHKPTKKRINTVDGTIALPAVFEKKLTRVVLFTLVVFGVTMGDILRPTFSQDMMNIAKTAAHRLSLDKIQLPDFTSWFTPSRVQNILKGEETTPKQDLEQLIEEKTAS